MKRIPEITSTKPIKTLYFTMSSPLSCDLQKKKIILNLFEFSVITQFVYVSVYVHVLCVLLF